MSRLLRKIIKYSRLGIVRRYFKYKEYTDLLNIDGGFVVDVKQLCLKDKKLYSLGSDPTITIKLIKPTNRLKIDFQIDMGNEKIQLFYIPTEQKKAPFLPGWVRNIGKCDNTFYSQEIILPDTTRNLRLDLCEDKGLIDIKKIKIVNYGEKAKKKELCDLMLNTIPSAGEKNLIVVTHAMNETGAPLLAYNIAKKFKEKKYNVVVLSISEGYLERKYNELLIPVINLRQSLAFDKIDDLELLDYYVSKLREKGYNKVIVNTVVSGLTVPTFSKYAFTIVSLVHEMKTSITKYNMIQSGNNINMYSKSIVFPDKIVEKEFYEVFNKNSENSLICPQGLYKDKEEINLDRNKVYESYNIPKNAKIIVGSGTADFRKGIDLFLEAAQLLINEEDNEKYHFIWLGKIANADLDTWFNCQFEKLNKQNRFHNIDFITDKIEYQNLISCCHAFWLTSREDPFPSVMIESLEYGTPVLAFKNCGGANTLLGQKRGTLIDNFDVKELALQTKELLKDEKQISTQIAKAQKYIKETLNFNNYIESLEEFLNIKESNKYANLSVIVPNYNYENYIEIRLNSIINQTIKPKEIIFLDDVSKDNSVEIAEKILKKAKKKYNIDFKIVVNENNNGCFRQWLKGIELAKYEYVWIAEADDYAKPNFVETLMDGFKDKDVVISYCQSKVINENGDVSDYDYTSYTNDLDENKWHSDFIDDGELQIKNYFSKKNIIPNVSSSIIRKTATKNMKKELSSYNVIGDWLAYILLMQNGKVFYSSKILNGHRRHSNSIIAKKERTLGFIKEILSIKKYILEHIELNDKEINEMLLSIERLADYYNIIMSDEETKKIYRNFLRKTKEKCTKENLLIVVPDLNVGGGQTVSIRIANSMIKNYNVFLINAQQTIETPFMRNMISKEVKVLSYTNAEDLKVYNDLLKFKSVISFIWWSDKLAYQVFGDSDTKLIISMHGCYEMLLHNKDVDNFFNDNYDKVLNRADRIVYTAEKNKEVLDKLEITNFSKVSKIDNGFILGDYPHKNRAELGINHDDFVFGLVARAIPEKGYEEAIIALQKLNKKSLKKAHLVLVGGSSYIDKLKIKYKDSYIHFVDKFTLPLEWIGWESIFDVGILPTYFKSESLPTVIIENLFLGNPIIATDIAEIKSMIIQNNIEAGITIGLKDGKANIDELTQAMDKMMNDKKMYNKMKNDTKIAAKRFDMDKCIKSYTELIEGEENE